MRISVIRSALAVIAASAMLVVAACGGDDEETTPTTGGQATTGASGKYADGLPKEGQKKGGSVRVLSAESFQHLDPGTSYFQLDYMVVFAAHRPLYYYRPENATDPVPDLAEGPPEVSSDGKTVTVKIRSGVKYGTVKPSAITGKEVTSADVKYAIERGYNPHVVNGYLTVYFPLVGADKAKGGPISSIETPDDRTLVLRLSKPFGATTAKALVMPITMPVPKSHAAPLDAKNPSAYDANPTQQAFTGPYMISEYSPGKSLTLIRNPEWTGPDTGDIRPAYLDKVSWTMGSDPNVAGRQVFNGSSLLGGDPPAASVVKLFAQQKPKSITFPAIGNRFVSLNYTKKPFSNVNARKALAAVLDRNAMRQVRGGPLVGDIATHFLPPGLPGFEEAGGMKGLGVDYLANPSGDFELAKEYMKKAGYPSGLADGEKVLMLGDLDSPAKEDAQIVQQALRKLGFNVTGRFVEHSVFYSKFCQLKEQLEKIDVCANFGWLPDFADPYAMLYGNFSGKAIIPVNGNNPSLYNNPQINEAMDRDSQIADAAERAAAWGRIDRQLVEDVAAIPWLWDKQANIASENVEPVVAKWNSTWDLSYVSLR